MAIKSEALIYKIIEEHLKASGAKPMSCVDLWDHNDVRINAKSTEKVSDYLGLMWRRGLIQRWTTPSDRSSKARFGYTWKEITSEAMEPKPIVSVVRGSYKKANVTMTEVGDSIVLDFDHFTITIRSKS
jgi:hypothetical protein